MGEDQGQLIASGDTALVRFLFPKPAERRTASIFGWWERRRLPYNLIVGASGMLTLGLAGLLSLLPPNPSLIGFAWGPIVATGVFANVCYTLGPIAEVAAEKLFKGRLLPIGPTLFRSGLVLSVGVTFVLPVIIVTLSWLAQVFLAVF